jgi:hypothetical protein
VPESFSRPAGEHGDTHPGERERLVEENERLREENRQLRLEHRSMYQLYFRDHGEDWLRGREATFPLLLSRRLHGWDK